MTRSTASSPPPRYWGLRDYGLRPVRWGGQARCEHEWEMTRPRHHPEGDRAGSGAGPLNTPDVYDASQGGSTCQKCGGWLGQLGLEPTPERFVEHLAGVFDEVRRVLRPDGTLWLNLGDTYATHPSGLAGEKRWKASTLSSRDHTGAEQAGRIDKRAPGLKPKDLVGIPWRVAFELQRRGWWLRSDCVWAKPNPMPEAVRDRPTRAHDSVFLLTKSRRYFYDAYAVREPLQESTLQRLRHHLPNPADNRASRSKHPEGDFRRFPMLRNTSPSGRNLRTVWWIPTQPYRGAHFATFPEKLPELCIQAGTSERGACADCGTPWTREVRAVGGAIGRAQKLEAPLVSGRAPVADAPGWHDGSYRRLDMGFRKRCSCETTATVPCLVLDPFAGSGTVLAVARRLRPEVDRDRPQRRLRDSRSPPLGRRDRCCGGAGGGPSMTRAAVYARVSTKEQSTEAQVGQLTAYCQARGWAEVAVFRDDGISGVRDSRPELDRLRKRMAEGEFDTIVVSKMDRLGRSFGMILRLWDEADAAGVRVIVVDQGIDTSTPSRTTAAQYARGIGRVRARAHPRADASRDRTRSGPREEVRSATENLRVDSGGCAGPEGARRESPDDLTADEPEARRRTLGPKTRVSLPPPIGGTMNKISAGTPTRSAQRP